MSLVSMRLVFMRLFVATLGALCALTACSSSEIGLPDTELELLDGGTVVLGETDGPRVVNLWATWCAPCREELPVFDRAASVVKADGIEIIGVNVGDSATAARELVDELGLDFAQALDPDADVQVGMRITGMPATILLDADGEVITVHSGEVDGSELAELLADVYGTDPGLDFG